MNGCEWEEDVKFEQNNHGNDKMDGNNNKFATSSNCDSF